MSTQPNARVTDVLKFWSMALDGRNVLEADPPSPLERSCWVTCSCRDATTTAAVRVHIDGATHTIASITFGGGLGMKHWPSGKSEPQ